jgi:hypothetical protein
MAGDILPIFPHSNDDAVYEVVDPAEIDMVVASLGKLIRTVKSPTIRDLLETVRQDIACLNEEEMLDIADLNDPKDDQHKAA